MRAIRGEMLHLLAAVVVVLAAAAAAQPLSMLQAVISYYRRVVAAAGGGRCLAGPAADQYDFVVVGAGTAGSAVAARLSEAAPGWSVLVLEAGDVPSFYTDIPLLVSYVLSSDYNWGYRAQPSPHYCRAMRGGRCKLSAGKAVGGSTVVNYMLYTRGSQEDYDAWKTMGNPGWGYHDIFPYLMRLENMSINELRSLPYHSTNGPIHVEHVRYRSQLAPLFLKAAQNLGLPDNNDLNGPSSLGVSYVQSTTMEGSRVTAWKAYLKPACSRPNLTVTKKARVTRVIVDHASRRVTGVEVFLNGRSHTINAKKEVVLSAGNFNSAQLLMLSGIGPKNHLQQVGVPVIVDLPVGSRTQDHVAFGGLTFLVNASVTLAEKRVLLQPQHGFEYAGHGTGPLTLPGGAEVLGFLRTRRAKPGDRSPDVELIFTPAAYTGDLFGSLSSAFGLSKAYAKRLFSPVQGRDAFSIVPVLLKPNSSGTVRLATSNPFNQPLVYTNYLSHRNDVLTMIDAIKLVLKDHLDATMKEAGKEEREQAILNGDIDGDGVPFITVIVDGAWSKRSYGHNYNSSSGVAVAIGESAPLQKYNSTLYRAPYPGCESLPFGSDPYWECAARHITINLQHHVGSCRMGPTGDPLAVVDPQLRVKGIKGLRVVDCSVIPEITSAHTMVPAYVIGEKAADIITAAWTMNHHNRNL